VNLHASAKASSFTESVIREMTRLANLHGAINLGQGFPDFPCPPELKAAACAAIVADDNQYPMTYGTPALRAAIAEKTARTYPGWTVDPATEVCVTCGATEALVAVTFALLDPGDEIVLFEPWYENYRPNAILSGAVVRPVLLREPDWSFDEAELRAAFGPRTKAVFLCHPNNPTGKVYRPDELALLAELCARWDAVLVVDSIYEPIHQLGPGGYLPPALVPGLEDRTVTVNALSKTYAMTGWRVGWMIGPKDVTTAAANFQSHATSNVANVSQRAALAAVSGDLEAVAMMRSAFERRGRTMHRMLNDIPGVTCLEPQGAFYCFPSFEGLLGREFDGRPVDSTLALADVILDKAKVALVPGEAFGSPGYMRLSFALGDEDLIVGVGRLQELFA
jgi:aminotransferase